LLASALRRCDKSLHLRINKQHFDETASRY
jgi:hypothetical protein